MQLHSKKCSRKDAGQTCRQLAWHLWIYWKAERHRERAWFLPELTEFAPEPCHLLNLCHWTNYVYETCFSYLSKWVFQCFSHSLVSESNKRMFVKAQVPNRGSLPFVFPGTTCPGKYGMSALGSFLIIADIEIVPLSECGNQGSKRWVRW